MNDQENMEYSLFDFFLICFSYQWQVLIFLGIKNCGPILM